MPLLEAVVVVVVVEDATTGGSAAGAGASAAGAAARLSAARFVFSLRALAAAARFSACCRVASHLSKEVELFSFGAAGSPSA